MDQKIWVLHKFIHNLFYINLILIYFHFFLIFILKYFNLYQQLFKQQNYFSTFPILLHT